jgi:hypothetical protein
MRAVSLEGALAAIADDATASEAARLAASNR